MQTLITQTPTLDRHAPLHAKDSLLTPARDVLLPARDNLFTLARHALLPARDNLLTPVLPAATIPLAITLSDGESAV